MKFALRSHNICLTYNTMCGAYKLYSEHLGRYDKQLAADRLGKSDFRCIRFPGLTSALTVPSGDTSDYPRR